LIAIGAKLAGWLEEDQGIKSTKLPYHIERGGIFLKDAAAMAGLGCLGRDNLLVTPQYGPRARLWALAIDRELPVTGPVDFDPCPGCDEPCRRACPQESFARKIYSTEQSGVEQLPARNGVYDRNLCNVQMELDVAQHEPIAVEGRSVPGKLVRFCRLCEFACPVGKPA
jgi:epoxyqueuosine reductase